MGGVSLMVAIPVALLIGSEEKAEPDPTVSPPPVGKRILDRDLGVAMRLPAGWRHERRRGVLRLRGGDGQIGITISAPGPAGDASVIRRSALEALRQRYRRVRLERRVRGERVGGLRSKGAALTARDPQRASDLRILALVAPGRKRAYLVEVFTYAGGTGEALLEGQVVLGHLKLKG